eukprot:Skav218047  [mRNA]  locus=scaffold214:972494:972703:- [translate_table: standard]
MIRPPGTEAISNSSRMVERHALKQAPRAASLHRVSADAPQAAGAAAVHRLGSSNGEEPTGRSKWNDHID